MSRTSPPRRRYGYDTRFWGETAKAATERQSYWSATRRPIPCLAFVGPLLLIYELGVLWLGGSSAEALRTGADGWMRHVLARLGVTDQWFLPLSLVLVLVAWQVVQRQDWRFPLSTPVGMVLESLVLGVALVGLSRLVDVGFSALEHSRGHVLALSPVSARLIGFVGAGVYEEALFRLILIPLLFALLRVLQTPAVLASTAAMTVSALLFSLAHHAGTPGEAFTWFAFIFRWLAGVYFAWVFMARGFGIAVGTHTAYDMLVGWLGWHL
ncbi:MAG: CPBP family intramembrane metalloprotease [Isosphaeraceae bacterium]|nr:CPBP family intramembrane metalloprotease [Isosphaeraceae bacterium]